MVRKLHKEWAEAGVRASRATTFIFRKAATTITFLTLSQRPRDNIRIILPVIRRKRAGLHHPSVPRLLPNGLQPGDHLHKTPH